MTRTKPRRDIAEPRRAMRTRRPPTGMAALLLVLVMSTGMACYALWMSQATLGAVITSGNLGVSLGDFSWECSDDCGSGTDGMSGIILRGDQKLVLRQEITADFAGDNLNVAMSTQFCPANSEDCSLPTGVSATWHLEIGGTSTLDAPITDPILIPDPTSVGTLDVVVTLQTQLEPSWVDPTTTAAPAAGTLELGVMTITANQVRCGTGFSVSCPAGSLGGG